MSSSRPTSRVLRRDDAPAVSVAAFAVALPGAAHRAGHTVAERIEAATAEAYRRGVDDGRAQAAAELAASAESERRRQLGALAAAVGRAVDAVAAHRRSAVAVAEVEVAHLAVELAEAVLGRELALGQAPVVDALRRAVALVPDGADLIVRLHPDDVTVVGDLPSAVAEAAGVVGQVQVVADPAVEPGGCVVDAGPCRIDAQIGSALARARQVLAELQANRPGELAESGEADRPGEAGEGSTP